MPISYSPTSKNSKPMHGKKLCQYWRNVGNGQGGKEVLNELSGTPFEHLTEEQEEGMSVDTKLDKQIIVLNESFINFFKGT